ncbi:MAG TPA: arginine--tRNA ligase, partial [Paludibacteraceae bacterium]|nr:arginine--tRNA ligase [Paludibacteraceae bacterium]
MNLESTIQSIVAKALKLLYGYEIDAQTIQIQKTKKEFEGDLTVVVFPFAKICKRSPEQIASEIGNFLLKNNDIIESYNAIKGFLNLKISTQYWLKELQKIYQIPDFGIKKSAEDAPLMMIEYSSP